MKIPKKLKIGTMYYNVRLSNKLDNKKMGEISCNESEINLNINYHRELMNGTLMHEICEAIKLHNSLNISHEALSVLSEQLYVILAENNLLKEK